MSLLEVRKLSRHFGDVRAVDDVSFSLDAGTILGFIGPNGAGKTTTMRILATLDAPTSGEVVLGGRSAVDEPDAVRPLIGFMPDRYGSYEDMTVLEYLDFFARAYGLRGEARRKRIEDVIELTGLHPLRDKLASTLSKGGKQRAALGRTLLHDPQLLILDEPADGLDPRARIELRDIVRTLASRGKAIVISSHILSELSEICDSCAIIEQGRLLATGPVGQVLSRGPGGPAAELVVRLAAAGDIAGLVAAATRVATAQADVIAADADGATLCVKLQLPPDGDTRRTPPDAAAARLLRALVDAGIPVCSFHLREADLEDVFMSVTRGRVS